jgi:hypothetical protein
MLESDDKIGRKSREARGWGILGVVGWGAILNMVVWVGLAEKMAFEVLKE